MGQGYLNSSVNRFHPSIWNVLPLHLSGAMLVLSVTQLRSFLSLFKSYSTHTVLNFLLVFKALITI